MKRYAPTLVLVLISSAAMAQGPGAVKSNGPATAASSTIPAPPAITANTTPIELARAALMAQGGDKFKNLKSMMLTGSADLYAPNSTASIPGKFAIVTTGDKVRIDIDARPIFNFKQIFDGQRSYSSIPGAEMPPPSKFGLPVLAKFDQPGYTVSALPDKKKLRGFRIVDAEGNIQRVHLRNREFKVQGSRWRARTCQLFTTAGNAGGGLLCRIQSQRR